MTRVIFDAEGSVFGRLCSYAAKKAIEGNEVVVLNSEKVVITGDKNQSIKKYMDLRKKGGHSQKGPRVSKTSFQILKRGIRGMLPDHREGFGKETISRIKCYNGIPKEFEGQKMIKIPGPNRDKYIELKELTSRL